MALEELGLGEVTRDIMEVLPMRYFDYRVEQKRVHLACRGE